MTGTTARRTVVSVAVSAALACVTACTGPGGSDDAGHSTGPTGSARPSASAPASSRAPALTGPSADALRKVERATGRAGSARVESTTVMGRELTRMPTRS